MFLHSFCMNSSFYLQFINHPIKQKKNVNKLRNLYSNSVKKWRCAYEHFNEG